MSDDAIIIDGYELLNCIATGSNTQIWEVRQQGLNQSLAMKLLFPEAFEDREQRNLLKQEARISEMMEHPNFIRFHGFSMKRPYGYVVMEYFRALNLKQQIRSDFAGLQSRLKTIMEATCQGLAYMHDKGWIHLDLKPDNILANKSGEIRLIDFSLARRPFSSIGKMLTNSKKKPIKGTRTYLAPETIRRMSPCPATDFYSLGITMYEIMAGQTPFTGTSPDLLLENHLVQTPLRPSRHNDNITPEADELVLRLLEKSPKKRFDTANDFLAELSKISLFKRNPLLIKAEDDQRLREEAEEKLQSDEAKLDSRADAERVAKGLAKVTAKGAAPAANQGSAPPAKTASKPAAAATPGQGQVPPPGMPPQGMPPAPGQFPPGQPYPGQAYPGQPYPMQMPPGQPMPPMGMPFPPGMPPQMPPGMPSQPPMGGEPMPVPPQVPASQQPPVPHQGQPVPPGQTPPPEQQQPSPQQPPAKKPTAPPPPVIQDTPSMDDFKID